MPELTSAAITHRSHYAHAPITEALIDIRATVPTDVTVEDLTRAHREIEADYPKMASRLDFHGMFSAGARVGATAQQDIIGSVFFSKDEKQIAQLRRDGFTFSRLAPYDDWENLRDEARRLWSIYRSIAKPTEISRVALRYINQINIPLPMRDFRDYLRTYPEVSTDLPQELAGFFMQTQIPQKDIGAILILTQTMVPPPDDKTSSVVLDVDVFIQDMALLTDEDIWGRLELLRNRKNEAFEACITNQTRRMIT
jgi:uncharacterized protein (TIGR04255 family)